MLRIVVERKGEVVWDRAFEKRLISIGRAEDNDLVLADEQVSSHHLVVKRNREGAFTAIDRSANGTFFEGQRMSTLPLDAPRIVVVADYEVTLIPVYRTDTVEAEVPEDQATTVTEDLPEERNEVALPESRPGATLRLERQDGRIDSVDFVDSAIAGRDEECDLRLPSREISRRHAFFFRRGGHYLIKRLSKVNPIRVNSRLLHEGESSELFDGDVIDMSGHKIEFLRPGNTLDDRVTLAEGRQPNLGFSIETRREGREISRIELLGFLGEKSVPRFESETEKVTTGATKVIVDLGYLIGIDDSGIGSLVRLAAECDRRKARFAIENAGPRVLDVFRNSSMWRVLEPYIERTVRQRV